MDAYQKEQLSNWVSDYALSEVARAQPNTIRDAGPFLLQELLQLSVERCGSIEDLSEKVMGEELVALSQRYELSEKVLKQLPEFLAGFFEDLQTVGRFTEGDGFGRYLRTFSGRLGVQTVKRPGVKISRNDPCPCGSGKKFKKCCQGK